MKTNVTATRIPDRESKGGEKEKAALSVSDLVRYIAPFISSLFQLSLLQPMRFGLFAASSSGQESSPNIVQPR